MYRDRDAAIAEGARLADRRRTPRTPDADAAIEALRAIAARMVAPAMPWRIAQAIKNLEKEV